MDLKPSNPVSSNNRIEGLRSIGQTFFDQWILNLQILYLVITELKTDQVALSTTATTELGVFVQSCIQKIPPQSVLKPILQVERNHTKKEFRKLIKQLIEIMPTEDSNLRWLFELELSEIGEKLEHWLYDQLLLLKDDILQNTIVLSSLTFLTNLQKKMHKETDFIIISWERKLIISIELKRTITDEKVIKQLESSHQIFEERLGDQLKSGWTYFPVICEENDTLSISNQHYITTETQIKPWLSSIFNRFQIVPINPLDEVKDLLKILIFAIHVSKKDQVAPIISSTWVKYTSNAIQNVSTSHNILFYSNQQMTIMNNDDIRWKRVLIRGPFGSGKTILLQEKAIQLNEQLGYNGKVLFVVTRYLPAFKSILYHRLKIELEENRGILVEHFNWVSFQKFVNTQIKEVP